MELVKISKAEALKPRSKVTAFVQRFLDGEDDFAQVVYETGNYATPYSCANALRVAIGKMRARGVVRALVYRDGVYLEKIGK